MQTLKLSKIILTALASLLVFFSNTPVFAVQASSGGGGGGPSGSSGSSSSTSSSSSSSSGDPCDKKTPTANSLQNCLQQNPIIKDVKTLVNFLSAGVGIVVVGSIIFAGIQYIMAGNNPNAVSAAKKRIQDTIIALLAFFFIYAFLNWLIPGGLLSGII